MKSIMILAILLCGVVGVADDSDKVVRVIVEGNDGNGQWQGLGSGVVLDNGLILTAKHVLKGGNQIKVRTADGVESVATVVAITNEPDGPALLQFPFAFRGFPITNAPPPEGANITMIGFGPNDVLHREACTVQTGSRSQMREGGLPVGPQFKVNDTDCVRTIGGDSGGPAILDGKVCGCVLSGAAGQSTSICSWASIQKIYSATLPQFPQKPGQPICRVISAVWCQPCKIVKADIKSGKFRDIAVDFEVVNIEHYNRKKELTTVPSFEFDGEILTGKGYTEFTLREWLNRLLGRRPRTPPQQYPPQQYPTQNPDIPAPQYPAPTPPMPTPTATPDGQKKSALDDIDWSGVRVGVLVSSTASDTVKSGVIAPLLQRVLDVATKGRVTIEAIHEDKTPARFRNVRNAIGIVTDFKVYPFATVDKVVDVGFFKSIAVSKIEAAADNFIGAESMNFVPDFIFRRSHPDHWERVTSAMGAVQTATPEGGLLNTLVATLLSFFGAQKATRIGRGVLAEKEEKKLAMEGDA